MTKQFVLKDGEQPGIYSGLGVARVGEPMDSYGPEHEAAFMADNRFKVYHAPKAAEPEPEPASAPSKEGK